MRAPPSLVAAALLIGLALPAATPAAVGPTASRAPGRIVIPLDDAMRSGDETIAVHAAALPDGSTLLFGASSSRLKTVYVAKVGPRGQLDRSFAGGGVTALAVPDSATFSLRQVLRRADGKLLLVGARTPRAKQPQLVRMQITRLHADATLDRTYGVDGTATTSLLEACTRCAALQPGGAVVLTGTTGVPAPAPGVVPKLPWSITRLTPGGAIDRSFGSRGIVTIPTPISTYAGNIAIGAGGTIVTGATMQHGDPTTRLVLTRLTSSGAPDSTFAGGTPVVAPFQAGYLMLLHDDGSIVVNGQTGGTPGVALAPNRQLLARYTAAGVPDQVFGSGGIVDFGIQAQDQFLPAPGGVTLTVERVSAPGFGATPARGGFIMKLVRPDGSLDPVLGGAQGRFVDLPFGGGITSYPGDVGGELTVPLSQNGFQLGLVVPRIDGSYLAAGGLRVVSRPPNGRDSAIGHFAAAALKPALDLDPAFGGPATELRLAVRVPRQRARTALTRPGILVRLMGSAAGLARVKITRGGRALARGQLPLSQAAPQTLAVDLTPYGRSYLRRRRNVRVSVTATGRDLLTNTATTTVRGRLR